MGAEWRCEVVNVSNAIAKVKNSRQGCAHKDLFTGILLLSMSARFAFSYPQIGHMKDVTEISGYRHFR